MKIRPPARHSPENILIARIQSFQAERGLSLEQLASTVGISQVYLHSLITGTRNIKDMPITGFRKISSTLGIPVLSALIMAGTLKTEDLIVQ